MLERQNQTNKQNTTKQHIYHKGDFPFSEHGYTHS
jgi:hypothetical protein